MTLDLPRVLEAPIAFDSMQSLVKWERREGATKVKLEQLEISNADLSGGASGTYRTLPQRTGGDRDRRARVARRCAADPSLSAASDRRGDAPVGCATALVSGTAVDSRFKVSGNLADFPFAHGKGGKLMFTTKAKGVTLAHTEGWPAIEAIDADVRIDGARLAIDAARGRVYGVDIGRTRVEIPDMSPRIPRCCASTAKRRARSPNSCST